MPPLQLAALGSTALEERLLEALSLPLAGKAFDGNDVCARCLKHRDEATVHQHSVHQDAARATFAFAAAFFGAGQFQVVPQDIQEALHGMRLNGDGLSVDG